MLGSVSLKGIGNQDVAEVVRLTHEEAEVSMLDERPLVQLLEQERHALLLRLHRHPPDGAVAVVLGTLFLVEAPGRCGAVCGRGGLNGGIEGGVSGRAGRAVPVGVGRCRVEPGMRV